MQTFGKYVKSLRKSKGFTLRGFCKAGEFVDASNWSRIERDLSPPPKDIMIIKEVAKVLGVYHNSEEFKTMVDLAAIGRIPKELVKKSILGSLPMFFRLSHERSPTIDELNRLIEAVRESSHGVYHEPM